MLADIVVNIFWCFSKPILQYFCKTDTVYWFIAKPYYYVSVTTWHIYCDRERHRCARPSYFGHRWLLCEQYKGHGMC